MVADFVRVDRALIGSLSFLRALGVSTSWCPGLCAEVSWGCSSAVTSQVGEIGARRRMPDKNCTHLRQNIPGSFVREVYLRAGPIDASGNVVSTSGQTCHAEQGHDGSCCQLARCCGASEGIRQVCQGGSDVWPP